MNSRALVLTQGTAAFAPFAEHVAVAAATGCAGVSVWAREISGALESGFSLSALRRVLDDHGLFCNDVDALVIWAGSGDPDRAWLRGAPHELLLEAGVALGARHANCVISGDAGYTSARGAEAFASAAELVRAAGMIPTLEFVPQPISPVSRVAEAWALIRESGCESAGVLVDTWHFMRGGSTLAELRSVPGERLLGLQINDAPARAEPDLADETMHRRLLPGDGDIPLVPILRVLDAARAPAPCTIEVFSDALRALGPREAALRAVEATRRVLAAAAHP
jgi:sugar phosphate isomerase/epimerase